MSTSAKSGTLGALPTFVEHTLICTSTLSVNMCQFHTIGARVPSCRVGAWSDRNGKTCSGDDDGVDAGRISCRKRGCGIWRRGRPDAPLPRPRRCADPLERGHPQALARDTNKRKHHGLSRKPGVPSSPDWSGVQKRGAGRLGAICETIVCRCPGSCLPGRGARSDNGEGNTRTHAHMHAHTHTFCVLVSAYMALVWRRISVGTNRCIMPACEAASGARVTCAFEALHTR